MLDGYENIERLDELLVMEGRLGWKKMSIQLAMPESVIGIVGLYWAYICMDTIKYYHWNFRNDWSMFLREKLSLKLTFEKELALFLILGALTFIFVLVVIFNLFRWYVLRFFRGEKKD